jgi:hypothetical protein
MKLIEDEDYPQLDRRLITSASTSNAVPPEHECRIYSSHNDPKQVFKRSSAIIAIPAQNEELFIAKCLLALARQTCRYEFGVVLLLNNCTDQTLAVVRSLSPQLPIPIVVVDMTLPGNLANAGTARGLAMETAARLAAPDSILMTTDADGRAYPDWITANLAALDTGAEVVAGRAELDSEDANRLPVRLQEDDEIECAYDRLLDQIHAQLDPDPADPWPRHTEHSGASIAVTLSAYRKTGGIPAVPVGEDRAFIEALRRVDARIRHAPEVRVVVSGRIQGRAPGGMADTIRRRLVRSDETLDGRLEPARIATERAWMRGYARQLWSADKASDRSIGWLSVRSKIPAAQIRDLLASARFGEAWFQLESRSPALRRLPVLLCDVPMQMRAARRILDTLDNQNVIKSPALEDPSDSADSGAAQLL